MKLPNISTQDSRKCSTPSVEHFGFTLIEILIVMAIVSFIAIIGIIVSIDTYNRYIFRSDLDKTVALLQKARSSAMSNINEKEYGVYLEDSSNLIFFRGSTFDPSDSFNYKVEKSKTATSTNSCSDEVVFQRLTGKTTACEIVITEGNKVATTTINNQGGINY